MPQGQSGSVPQEFHCALPPRHLFTVQSVKRWKTWSRALVLKCKGLQKTINNWRTPSLFKGSRYCANVGYLYYRLFTIGVNN